MAIDDDYWKFAKERDTMKENVKALLIRFPQCRESYKLLLFYYWHYIDGMISVLPSQLTNKLSSPEAITRTFRRVVANDPTLQPTAKTTQQRDIQLERFRRYYGKRDKNYKED
jgi:hypothetical protein